MRDKQYILSEIQRIAEQNNGKPVGKMRFKTQTGISHSEWEGVYWARWGDALQEAGFAPLEKSQAINEEQLFDELAKLTRKYGRYPVYGELRIEKRANAKIPTADLLNRRFKDKAEVIRKVSDYCSLKSEYQDVIAILAKELAPAQTMDDDEEVVPALKSQSASGYVYMVKSGKLYKIGFSENHWRRKSELHKQTAEGISEVHTIAAIDDAPGIEKYWHERFKEKRQHGEWFDLSAEDVSAFKKRKFM